MRACLVPPCAWELCMVQVAGLLQTSSTGTMLAADMDDVDAVLVR